MSRRIPSDSQLLENLTARVVAARLTALKEDLELIDIADISEEPYFLIEGKKIVLTYNLANKLNGWSELRPSSPVTISAGGAVTPTTNRMIFAAIGQANGWQVQLYDSGTWKNMIDVAGNNVDGAANVLVVFPCPLMTNTTYLRFYNGAGGDTTSFKYFYMTQEKDITEGT